MLSCANVIIKEFKEFTQIENILDQVYGEKYFKSIL